MRIRFSRTESNAPFSNITLLRGIHDFRLEFRPAARTAADQSYQPRLHRMQHLFPRNTNRRCLLAAEKLQPPCIYWGVLARPLGLEPRTLCLEGKEDGARALYLQGYYSVFLRKSTPRRGAPRVQKLCRGLKMV